MPVLADESHALNPNTISNGSSTDTHCDVAVRLDFVDPEPVFHHGACPVQQLFQLAQSEGSNLWDKKRQAVSY